MVEMKVNPGELAAGGRGLEEAANGIPEPLAPFTATGTDALSTILATLTQEKEAPLITGLPATKAEALATAQNIVTAAGMYERSDLQIATDVTNASAGLDGTGGSGSSSAGGADQMQQMMSMPMQMAQQVGQMAGQVAQSVGQLPQGIMQGVQSGVQQIGQMTGGMGQSSDVGEQPDAGEQIERAEQAEDGKVEDDKREEISSPEGAAPGLNSAERAPEAAPQTGPESGAVPDATQPKHARTPDQGIVV